MLVVVINPGRQSTGEGERTGPFWQPEACLFHGAHHPLSVRMPRGVGVAGEGLMPPQRPACLHERHRGGLTAVVAHQREAWLAHAGRELAVHGHVQGGQPLRCTTLQAGLVPHAGLGLPGEHAEASDPANAFHQHCGHSAPPHSWGCVGCGGLRIGVRLARLNRTLRC